MPQVNLAHTFNLLVCVVHVGYFVDKPCRAVHVGVHYGHGLSVVERQYEVASVEHVEHGEDAVAVDFRHVAGSLGYGRHGFLHLGADVSLYHFLVAAQFCGVVSAYAVVEIRRLVLVERVGREVEHAEVAHVGLVLEYQLV